MFCNSAAGNLTVLLIRRRTRCQVTQVGDGDTGPISLQNLKLHGYPPQDVFNPRSYTYTICQRQTEKMKGPERVKM